MIALKILAALCLLGTTECADVSGLGTSCVWGTDTCTEANAGCWDRDNDGDTTCECTEGYYENSGSCTSATTLGNTCSTATCRSGAACTDVDGAGSGSQYCLCSQWYYAQGSSCVKSPGAACVPYGNSCGMWSSCSAEDGSSSIMTTCKCNSGYYSDGVKCVSGSNTASMSLAFILAAFVLERILR